jgi:formamidopyrimidine-DNA glycosylase
MNNKIESMSRALLTLNTVPIHEQTQEYKAIVESIKIYLNENCEHCIIEDDIDTGPESSKKIFYCKTCYLTFPPSKTKLK